MLYNTPPPNNPLYFSIITLWHYYPQLPPLYILPPLLPFLYYPPLFYLPCPTPPTDSFIYTKVTTPFVVLLSTKNVFPKRVIWLDNVTVNMTPPRQTHIDKCCQCYHPLKPEYFPPFMGFNPSLPGIHPSWGFTAPFLWIHRSLSRDSPLPSWGFMPPFLWLTPSLPVNWPLPFWVFIPYNPGDSPLSSWGFTPPFMGIHTDWCRN